MRDTQEHIIYGTLGKDEPMTVSELEAQHDRFWLSIAQRCHQGSTDFLDVNFRKQWENNLAHFNSEHATDSKFHASNYKNRNRLFRPKTRSIALRGEAALTRAMFATEDLVSVGAEDENDPLQRISAEINQELMQYRLSKTIPWFQTVIGAWQDTFNYGLCITYEYWEFETRTHRTKTEDLTEDGQPAFDEEVEVVTNKPCIDLLQPENFRFDVGADWRDVVGTSPFLERIVPLTVQEVESRMEEGSGFKWKKYDRGRIIAASRGHDPNESTRMARQGQGKQDPLGDKQLPSSMDTVFCREYIVKEGGIDWVFWTIGDQLMLTEPVELKEVYFHGRRPFTVGYSLLEAHKAIPTSKNQMIAPIQVSMNKLANQRFDNVDLVLNKRYFLRRGQNIDTPALMRNVPGGGVYMDNPETDVKIVSTPDVTSSAYEEHNRLSNEMDEIAGNFSTASVASNRQLNETVGGMQLNRASSDEITEYSIVTFIKTWVEPVLRHLLQLEQAYEDDQVILKLAAGKSEGYRKTNLQGDIPLQILMQELTVKVNVGIGNTDPTQRIDKLIKGVGLIVSVLPEAAARLDADMIIKEVLGGAGRSDGQRFFKPADQVQQGVDPATAAAQAAEETKRMQIEQESTIRMIEIESRERLGMAQLALNKEITLEKLYVQLGISNQGHQLKQGEFKIKALQQVNQARELEFKRTSGRDGI